MKQMWFHTFKIIICKVPLQMLHAKGNHTWFNIFSKSVKFITGWLIIIERSNCTREGWKMHEDNLFIVITLSIQLLKKNYINDNKKCFTDFSVYQWDKI